MSEILPPKFSEVVLRGLKNRCPRCATGKLLRGYLTPRKCCSHCGLDYEPLRADDGPAWATILITGHLTMPFVFWLLEFGFDNLWIEIGAPIAFIVILSAIILPPAKGAFMGIIWLMHYRKDDVTE